MVVMGMRQQHRRTTDVGWLFVFFVAFALGCGERTENAANVVRTAPERVLTSVADVAAHRPIERPHGGYVTSTTCLECHPDEHASWNASYHRTMTQQVSPETVLGKFDGRELEFYGWQVRPERRGDEFWMRIKGTQSDKRFDHKLVMSTGSHHMQKYWYETGKSRKLGLAPLVYLVEADRWVPEHTAFLRPTGVGLRFAEGGWNKGCNQCHATGSLPRIAGPEEMDTVVAEFGISCEACHGPGEKHLADKSPESIVNPRRLPADRSSQVCGQCHGAWVMKAGAGDHWSSQGHAFRPGDDLLETRHYVHRSDDKRLHAHIKAEDSFWADGEVRVAGREFNGLLSSPCFTHDKGDQLRMSCISCHDLHNDSEATTQDWANDQLATSKRGSGACLQCHESIAENLRQHTHHAADSAGSLCYNCHMPFTSYGLLKAVRSHKITSPSAFVTLKTGRPNACNQCHLDQTLEWTATQLTRLYGQPTVEVPQEHREIAASVVWSLKGDAAQRALMAWSLGWEEAQKTSGTDWMVLYLTDLMFDDYDAIRYIAHRSLTRISGFESIKYDHMRPGQQRDRVMGEVFGRWQSSITSPPTERRLLFDQGNLLMSVFEELREQRDNRKVVITE